MEHREAKILADFVDFCCQVLQISQRPQILVTENHSWTLNRHSFGEYNAGTGSVTVYIKARNIADVLRTVAHEMVHHRQNELGMIKKGSGSTGSEIENQANAIAGVIMREYGAMHKMIYENKQKNIQYKNPNFEREWEEAERYPEFLKMGKEKWIELARKGTITRYSKIKSVLGNVDLDFENLEKEKKNRFTSSFSRGEIEMPIVVKFNDKDYDLVAGNTRLSGLISKGYNPNLWVVKLNTKTERND